MSRKTPTGQTPPLAAAAASAKKTAEKTMYEILHVEKTANADDIARSYRVLAAELHPDKGGDEEKFRKVNEAYQILSNPETRRIYDTEGAAGLSKTPDVQFAHGFSSRASGTRAAAAAAPPASTTMSRLAQRVKDSQTVDFAAEPHAETFEQWLQRTRATGAAGSIPQAIDVSTLIERDLVPVINYERVALPQISVPCVSFESERWYPAETPLEKLVAVEHQDLPPGLGYGFVAVEWKVVPINPGDLLELRGIMPTTGTMDGHGSSASHMAPPVVDDDEHRGGRPRTRVAGNEGVGIVRKVGDGVKELVAGDLVLPKTFGLGTWRPIGVYRESQLIRLPKELAGLELHQLASMRELVAAYKLLEDFVELTPGDTLMQTAANGTVGQAIVQMCRTLRINTVNIVRPHTKDLDKIIKDRLKELGGTVVVDAAEPLWPAIKDARIPEPRLVLDCVGGNLTGTVSAAGDGATLVIFGGLSLKPHMVPTGKYIYNDLRVRGFLLQRMIKADVSAFLAAAEQVAVLLRANRLDVDADMRKFDPAKGESWRQFFTQALNEASVPGKLKKVFVVMPDVWFGSDTQAPTQKLD